MRWYCALTVCVAAQFAWQAPALAAGRCAFVDIDTWVATEPQEHCFKPESTCRDDEKYGCFEGPLVFKSRWVDSGHGKLRELSEPFGYIDPDGVHWDVPADFQTDGASIPLFFQPLIGGPWTETYIRAAVVHDFYIRRPSVSAEAVHKIFYLALLASGTHLRRAQEMYFAVARFGPQWKNVDMAAYNEAWRARKAMLDQLTELHKKMWRDFQESERRRKEQAAIDAAVLSRPLPERTRIFQIRDGGDTLAELDAFIEQAIDGHIVHPERDATLIASFREQVEAEVERPATERDNVFVLQFTTLGAQSARFAAQNEQELRELLAKNDLITRAFEQSGLPEDVCGDNCSAPVEAK